MLPYWQHVIGSAPTHPQRDCSSCMKSTDPIRRQAMRCGFLPLVSHVGSMPTVGFPYGDDGRADVCPGYSTSLPEVIDTAEAYPHWKERTLTEWLEGEPPTRETLHGLAVLGNAIGGFERWRMEQDRIARERQ